MIVDCRLGIHIFCLFTLLLLPISSYPQCNAESQPSEVPNLGIPHSETWYTKGKQALEGEASIGGAKGWLEFAKQRLSENLTVEILEEVFGQQELPLNNFFDKLLRVKTQKHLFRNEILTAEDVKNITGGEDISLSEFLDRLQNYSPNEVQSKIEKTYGGYTQMRIALAENNEPFTEIINDLKNVSFQEVNNQLRLAIDNFNQAIESDLECKVEASLKLADAYLVMNREQEAIEAYEKCRNLPSRLVPKIGAGQVGFENITSSIEEFNGLFHRMAKVYWKLDVTPLENNTLLNSEDNKDRFSNGVKSNTMPLIDDDTGAAVIEDYMKCAEAFFTEALQDPNELEAQLIINNFELVRFYLETCQLTRAREEFERRYEEVEAKLDNYPAIKDEIMVLDAAINQVTDTSFTCSFAPEFKKELFNSQPPLLTEAVVNFFPTGRRLSSKDLGQHFIVIVYPEEELTSVKLSNVITLNNYSSKSRCTIPSGNYKMVITIPQRSAQDKNRLPFQIKLSGPGVDELILSASSDLSRPDFRDKSRRELQNTPRLPQDISVGGTTFRDSILKSPRLSAAGVVTIQRSIYLFPGQAYSLSFEPLPPMPSRKRWWITAIAIAASISILTAIL